MQGNLAGGPASFGQVLQLGHWSENTVKTPVFSSP